MNSKQITRHAVVLSAASTRILKEHSGNAKLVLMSRLDILRLYKSLLRTASRVFEGDAFTSSAAMTEIRTQFREAKSSQEQVQEAYAGGVEAEVVLRKGVLQLVETEHGSATYKAKLRPEFALEDNVLFKSDITPEEYQKSIKAASKRKKK